MVKTLVQLTLYVLYALLIFVAIASFGSLFWSSYPLELLCHFRVYYLLIASGLAIALLIYRQSGFRVRMALWFTVALIAFNSTAVLPWYLPHSQQGNGSTLRVMTFNINVANTAWDAIADAVRQVNPDLAAMVETSAIAETQLAQRLGNRFPFVYRSTGGGLTLFSRLPLSDTESKTFQNGTVLRATVQVQETPVRLIATHPLVPVKPDLFRRRNGLLAELGADLQAQDFRPLILLGDFNLTPWSPYYTRLIQQTKLHNTRLGFGIEPSWIEATSYIRHPRWITTLVKIPIDHILVSQQFKVSDCRTAAAANADHRMLWSDLSL